MSKVDLTKPIFHDDDAARAHLEILLWPYGPTCPRCGVTGDRVTLLLVENSGVRGEHRVLPGDLHIAGCAEGVRDGVMRQGVRRKVDGGGSGILLSPGTQRDRCDKSGKT